MTSLHNRVNWALFVAFIWLSIIIGFRQMSDFSKDSRDAVETTHRPKSSASLDVTEGDRCHPQFCTHNSESDVSLSYETPTRDHALRLIGTPWRERQFHTFSKPHSIRASASGPLVLAAMHNAENFVTSVFLSQNSCSGQIEFSFANPLASRPERKLRERTNVSAWANKLTETYCVPSESFRIRVVGPEIESHLNSKCSGSKSTFRDDTPSTFVYSFALATSGLYHLEGEWMYSDFAAIDEKSAATIPMIRKPILPVVEEKGKYGEILGALHHDPTLNLYRLYHPEEGRQMRKSKFRSSKHFVWDQFTLRTNFSFSCRSTEPPGESTVTSNVGLGPKGGSCFSASVFRSRRLSDVFGRWVVEKTLPDQASWDARSHHLAHTHFERTLPAAIYRYAPLTTWCPMGLQGITPDGFLEAMSRRSVDAITPSFAFIGDSHVRVAFVHFKNFLAFPCQLEDHRVKSLAGKRCRVTTASGRHKASLVYANDVLLDDFIRNSSLPASSKVVVLGMGSWALGGQGPDPVRSAIAPENYGRWSIGDISRQMQRIGASVKMLLREDRQRIVVWMTIPAYPHNGRRFARLKGEHRTNPKIQLFNRLAVDELLNAVGSDASGRLRIVDQFDVTYPVMHLSLDHNHHTTYAQDAILQLLLNAVQEGF